LLLLESGDKDRAQKARVAINFFALIVPIYMIFLLHYLTYAGKRPASFPASAGNRPSALRCNIQSRRCFLSFAIVSCIPLIQLRGLGA
jgi:hypothetical protein